MKEVGLTNEGRICYYCICRCMTRETVSMHMHVLSYCMHMVVVAKRYVYSVLVRIFYQTIPSMPTAFFEVSLKSSLLIGIFLLD